MSPVKFPEANVMFGPPPDLEESQCLRIPAFAGTVQGGSVDGLQMVITAWLPSAEEIEQLRHGKPIYLSFIGGLPPHFVTTDFNLASHPA